MALVVSAYTDIFGLKNAKGAGFLGELPEVGETSRVINSANSEKTSDINPY